MQSMRYKTKVAPEMRAIFEQFVMTVEGMLFEKAKVNPKMMIKLSEFEHFPRFFVPDTPLSALTPPPLETGGIDTSKVKNIPEIAKDKEPKK